jgi:hypothetical protein
MTEDLFRTALDELDGALRRIDGATVSPQAMRARHTNME